MKSKMELMFCTGRCASVIRNGYVAAVVVCLLFCSISPVNASTPWLHVDGNQIEDPNGNVVVLRGVDMIDLGVTQAQRGGVVQVISRLTNKSDPNGSSPGWYPKVIRLPIVPADAAGASGYPNHFNPSDPNTYYNNILRPAVNACAANDVYAIIDWHYVAKTYEHRTTTTQFWQYMAPKFANDSHVIFELFNEPNNDVGSDDDDWCSVRTDMQTWVDLVRSYAPNNLILVAGASYSQNIGPAANYPLLGDNIAIVSHIYPGHWLSGSSWYVDNINQCLTVYPVFMSEWGFRQGASYTLLRGTITNYGQPLMDFREGLKISGSAWCTDYSWEPAMFYSTPLWGLRVGPNEMGGFTKDKLYEKRNDDQPGGPGQGPYGQIAWSIPGTIQAENYDVGGEGVAYHDTTTGNSGGAYRSDDVDIETCSEGGYDVTGIQTGEWLEYTTNIKTYGLYDLEVRTAAVGSGGSFHIEFDGTDVTGPVSVPATGGGQTYTTIQVNDVVLDAGYHVMRLSMDSADWNVNWIKFTKVGGGGTGRITREWWTGISGTSVSNLTSNVNYPNKPSGRGLLSTLEAPMNWADNYGTLISGYLYPITDGEYTFWIASNASSQLWVSTDDNPDNASVVAYVPDSNSAARQWDKYDSQESGPVWMAAGERYYIKVLHKAGTGDDHVAVAWQGPYLNQQIIDGTYMSPINTTFTDFAAFASQWHQANCGSANNGCNGFDFDNDGSVMLDDLAAFVETWLIGSG
ncbi:MAG: cellulase family glycosylhydrolase [Sedimentisphaerales bacterium]